MNRWLLTRLALVAVIAATACFAAYYYSPTNINFNQKLLYGIVAAGFVSAVGLTLVRDRYNKNQKTAESPTVPLNISGIEQKIIKEQQAKQRNAAHEDNDLAKLYEELGYSEEPQPPSVSSPSAPVKQPLSLQQMIDRKIMQKLADADVTISLTLKHENDEWKITDAESTIKSKPIDGKPTPPPAPPETKRRSG